MNIWPFRRRRTRDQPEPAGLYTWYPDRGGATAGRRIWDEPTTIQPIITLGQATTYRPPRPR